MHRLGSALGGQEVAGATLVSRTLSPRSMLQFAVCLKINTFFSLFFFVSLNGDIAKTLKLKNQRFPVINILVSLRHWRVKYSQD